MRIAPLVCQWSLGFAAFCLSGVALAQSTPERAETCALKSVRLGTTEDAPVKTVLLSGGRIEAILDVGAALPAGIREIDCEGLIATPALIDAFTGAGCETPTPIVDADRPVSTRANVLIDMREANRKGIQPAFRAANVLALDEDAGEKYRESGFGSLLSSPRGQLLAGKSALVTTRDAAMRDTIIVDQVFDHAAFASSGGGYPSTMMGFHAQLRQFFLDAQRHAVLKERWDAGKAGGRPSYDADLDAGAELLGGKSVIVCEANTHRDIARWIRLSDEFGLKIAIAGGRDAWKLADQLAAREIPVYMTLEWGKEVEDPDEKDEDEEPEGDAEEEAGEEEPESETEDEPEQEVDWTYDEPLGVKRENRRLWVEKRDCAIRLHEAGVRFAFSTGNEKPAELLKRVRTLVENGLPADIALAGLTESPAQLLGVDRYLGKIEPGYQAAIALWTKAPTEKKAKVAWMIVDGIPYEFEVEVEQGGAPAEGVDVTGEWTLTFDDNPERGPATLTLKMSEDGNVTGSYASENRFDPSSPLSGDIEGQVSDVEVTLETSLSMGGMSMNVKMSGKLDGDSISGDFQIKSESFEDTSSFSASRNPEQILEGGQQ